MSGFVSQPTTLALTLTNQDTEYSVALPAGTTRFRVQPRTAVDLKLAFQAGMSGALFTTLKAAHPPYVEDRVTGARTLYLQCGTAGTVVEILCWV